MIMVVGDLNYDYIEITVENGTPENGTIANYILANFPAGAISTFLVGVDLRENNKKVITLLVTSRQEA